MIEKAEAVQFMKKHSRNSITPEKAAEIAAAFGLVLPKGIIHSRKGSREIAYKSGPRVDMDDLAQYVCLELKCVPEPQHLKLSQEMLGAGSSMEEATLAYAEGIETGGR